MKKLNHFVLLLLTVFAIQVSVNAQCSGVLVTTFPLTPQSGPHNYFGVRATLVKAYPYSANVIVNGYIYDEGSAPNTDHPYELTITAGNMSEETSATFYETDATSSATISVTSVTPCPPDFDEVSIANYTSGTFTIDLTSQDRIDLFSSLSELLSLGDEATLDSIRVNDDDPTTIDSASYLVFYVTDSSSRHSSVGLYLQKHNDNGQIIYNLTNNSTTADKSWKCDVQTVCLECDPHRNWFLGPVNRCQCQTSESHAEGDCKFSTAGQDFPWGPILGFIGVLFGIFHNH